MSTRRMVTAIKGWVREAISKVAEVNPVTVLPPTELDTLAVPFYEMAAIDEYSGKLRDAAILPLRDCRTGKTKFQNGDVLFAKITPCVQNRKSALVNGLPGNFACGSSEFYVLRPGKRVMPEYLFYFIRQDPVIHAAVESFTGTSGRQRVPRTFWDRLEIPLPPLPVQQRIVQILQKADEIRQKRKQALELTEKILPALFLEMFGDPATNPKGWPVKPLGEVLTVIRNGTTTPQNTVGRGWPVSRIETISYETVNRNKVRWVELDEPQYQKWKLQVGDILFSHINSIEHIAKTAMYMGDPPNLVHGMNLLLLRTDSSKCLPEYLHTYLKLPVVRQRIRAMARQAVNQASLNQAQLKGLPIMLPPIAFQEKLQMAIVHHQSVLTRFTQMREENEILCQNLLSRAFTGELTAEWEAANAEWIAAQQTLYERLPRLLILALIAEKAKRARRSAEVLVTALMKYVFLFQMEGSASHRLLYHFVPYHFGPFAKELYADLEKLQEEGLVRVESDPEEDKTKIILADPAGADELLADLPEDLKEDAATILETYGHLDHYSLLKTVYEKYPAYAKKSRLRRGTKRE
mgnify:CR=1 FL=1